mgnify:CR=1 FL=1|jgi:hypothetical protein
MIEVTNKTKGPVQLLVRSKGHTSAFTTLILPAIGAGKNVKLLKEEIIVKDVLERVEKTGMISTRYVPNTNITKA